MTEQFYYIYTYIFLFYINYLYVNWCIILELRQERDYDDKINKNDDKNGAGYEKWAIR